MVDILQIFILFQIEAKNKTQIVSVAEWSSEDGYKRDATHVKEKFPRFFRIGTVGILISSACTTPFRFYISCKKWNAILQ